MAGILRQKMKIRTVKHNILMNFILKLSSILFPLLTYPYVLRVLHSGGNGRVAFVSAIVNYFVMIASLGIPTYGIKVCAKVRDDKEELSKTVQEILLVNMIATFFTAIAYFISINIVPEFKKEKILFYIFSFNLILNFIGVNWLYQALEQYDYITIRSLLFKALSIILMFLFVKEADDYVIYGGITVFAGFGSNVLNFIKSFSFVDYKKRKYDLKRHLKPVFILFAHSVATSVYTNLDIVMIRFLKNEIEVGLYDVAIKVKVILVTFITSMSDVLLPRMSYYTMYGKKKEFNHVLKTSFSIIGLFSIPVTVFFIYNSDSCIYILGGKDYSDAILMMRLLTITIITIGIGHVMASQILIPTNKEKYNLYAVIWGAITDLIFNIFLIPKFGGAGAAFATVMAEWVVLIWLYHYSREQMKSMISRKAFIIYFIESIVLLFPCYVIKQIFNGMLESNGTIFNIGYLIVSALIYFGIYVIILFMLKDETVIRVKDAFLYSKNI